MKEEKRIEYIDLLRIIATIGVIIVHVAAQYWKELDVSSFEWKAFNVWDSLARWSMPIFVMISGVLFLSRDYTISQLYKKYILRLVTAFFVWSFLYIIILYRNKADIISRFFLGEYHMWYLFMIMVLYMLSPVLKKIVETQTLTKYFLIIVFLFQTILPEIKEILDFCGEIEMARVFGEIQAKFNVGFGYLGYFVLGYYLENIELSKTKRRLIYILGIIGSILTAVLTQISSNREMLPSEVHYDYFSLNVVMEVIAVFVFAKYNFKTNQLFINISRKCFGIYLIHPMILKILDIEFDINTLSFNPIFSVPIITSIVLIGAYIISAVLNKNPILRKYMV